MDRTVPDIGVELSVYLYCDETLSDLEDECYEPARKTRKRNGTGKPPCPACASLGLCDYGYSSRGDGVEFTGNYVEEDYKDPDGPCCSKSLTCPSQSVDHTYGGRFSPAKPGEFTRINSIECQQSEPRKLDVCVDSCSYDLDDTSPLLESKTQLITPEIGNSDAETHSQPDENDIGDDENGHSDSDTTGPSETNDPPTVRHRIQVDQKKIEEHEQDFDGNHQDQVVPPTPTDEHVNIISVRRDDAPRELVYCGGVFSHIHGEQPDDKSDIAHYEGHETEDQSDPDDSPEDIDEARPGLSSDDQRGAQMTSPYVDDQSVPQGIWRGRRPRVSSSCFDDQSVPDIFIEE